MKDKKAIKAEEKSTKKSAKADEKTSKKSGGETKIKIKVKGNTPEAAKKMLKKAIK
jgi:hypothetical protein